MNKKMKQSKYNIMVDCPETRETILYNSLYGGLALWDAGEINIVKDILAHPLRRESANSGIWSALIKQKNLVGNDVDEMEIIKRRKLQGSKDRNRLDLIIMPTLDCNFACVYCYEKRRPEKMTVKSEKAIKNWITRQVPKYKFVMLNWFGGEPLLGYKQMISITKHALKVSAKSQTRCVAHVTTNGYLLNKKRISELIETGMCDYQITLDGPPETNDKLRILHNGKGTFAQIFKNIVNLARANENVKIALRVNFNRDNFHSIPKLLELFPVDVRPHLRVVYEPIFGHCSVSATATIPSEEISKGMVDYYKLAKQLGYDVVLSGSCLHPGKLVNCYAERENQYIVNYNLDVYKCSVGKFTPEERSGYINSTGTFIKDAKNFDKWTGTPFFETQCFDCAYLPLCMGGCRKMRIERKSTGSYCCLVPTNTSYTLKQMAYGKFDDVLKTEAGVKA